MKVKDLIVKLAEYNQDADFEVIAMNKAQLFTFVFGDSEGVKKEDCETVGLYLDDLCKSEV